MTMKGSLFTFAGWVIQETLESPKFVHFLKLGGGFGVKPRVAISFSVCILLEKPFRQEKCRVLTWPPALGLAPASL